MVHLFVHTPYVHAYAHIGVHPTPASSDSICPTPSSIQQKRETYSYLPNHRPNPTHTRAKTSSHKPKIQAPPRIAPYATLAPLEVLVHSKNDRSCQIMKVTKGYPNLNSSSLADYLPVQCYCFFSFRSRVLAPVLPF